MKVPTILTTAAMVAGFIPFGEAICFDGDIALVRLNDNSDVSTAFQSANSFNLPPYFEMIRLGRSVRTTATVSLLTHTFLHVGSMAMPP